LKSKKKGIIILSSKEILVSYIFEIKETLVTPKILKLTSKYALYTKDNLVTKDTYTLAISDFLAISKINAP